MSITNIEWTDRVWNPVTGCTKVSPGCKHCYAEGVAHRFWASQYRPLLTDGSKKTIDTIPVSSHEDWLAAGLARPRRFTDVIEHADRLLEPVSWRKPQRVFVNSMSDLFHEDVSDAFIARVFAAMGVAHQHTFQVLTKRPERMRAIVEGIGRGLARVSPSDPWPLANVWLGVSVEDQQRANERIPLLLQTPAAVRFISAEPLLGPVDLDPLACDMCGGFNVTWGEPGSQPWCVECDHEMGGASWLDLGGLDWVIVGGESGPGARGCRVAWIREIVGECRAAGVPVFVKQLGAKPEGDQRPPDRVDPVAKTRTLTVMQQVEIRNRKGGDMAEWPDDLRVREFPR